VGAKRAVGEREEEAGHGAVRPQRGGGAQGVRVLAVPQVLQLINTKTKKLIQKDENVIVKLKWSHKSRFT